jgi:hypothetical protein
LLSLLCLELQLTKMGSLGVLEAELVFDLEFPDSDRLSFFEEPALMESGKLEVLRKRGVGV